MTLVEFGGRAWIFTEDLGTLRSSQMPKGVRLLAPATGPVHPDVRPLNIVDRRYHREVWKSVGEPGALMTNGKITAIWRPRMSGMLAMIVKTFGSLREKERKLIQDEAEQVAVLRGAASAGVEFDTY
jgi:hypothetical protein